MKWQFKCIKFQLISTKKTGILHLSNMANIHSFSNFIIFIQKILSTRVLQWKQVQLSSHLVPLPNYFTYCQKTPIFFFICLKNVLLSYTFFLTWPNLVVGYMYYIFYRMQNSNHRITGILNTITDHISCAKAIYYHTSVSVYGNFTFSCKLLFQTSIKMCSIG